jgi:hypothetical protein
VKKHVQHIPVGVKAFHRFLKLSPSLSQTLQLLFKVSRSPAWQWQVQIEAKNKKIEPYQSISK